MNLNQQRLADQIRDIIAQYFAGGRLRDPRLEGVSITAVKMAQNYYHADVYYLFPQDDLKRADEVKKGLAAAKGHLRSQLARILKTRRVPALNFHYDSSVEHGSHIEKLLSQLNHEGGLTDSMTFN